MLDAPCLEHLAPFRVSPLPEIHFGRQTLARLPALIARHGRRVLLVTGRRSFIDSPRWPELQAALRELGVA